MSAIFDVDLLYNAVHRKFNQLETRCGRESQHPAEGALGTPDSAVWRPDPLVTRCDRESQHTAEWAPKVPGWATKENGKETQLWPIVRGSICCSSVRSPTPSHTNLSNKVRYIFLRTVLVYCVMISHACVCIAGYGYTIFNSCLVECMSGHYLCILYNL